MSDKNKRPGGKGRAERAAVQRAHRQRRETVEDAKKGRRS